MAAGLSRSRKSREGQRIGQDGTGRELETLKVPGPKSPGTSSNVPGLFLKVPGLPGSFFQVILLAFQVNLYSNKNM